ncbi:MAG: hypothetical protein IJ733_09470 [Lachnospiraceae bacterium]|nr:hypothetical protein [Lachnospiraceae bacterium]
MLEKEKYITLNDVGFDKTPILHEIGNEGYQVDEKELQKSIKKNRDLLISHGHGELFELQKVL